MRLAVRRALVIAVLLVLCGAGQVRAAGSPYLLVIVGLAGEPEHGELFRKWAGTLVDTAAGRFGIARDRIIYLDADAGAKGAGGKPTRQEIEHAFDRIAKQATADDTVVIVLIALVVLVSSEWGYRRAVGLA